MTDSDRMLLDDRVMNSTEAAGEVIKVRLLNFGYAFIAALAVGLMTIPEVAFAGERKETMPPTLREMLKNDFGMDLQIAGGFGQSRGDPIIILPSSDAEANQTEMLALRGLGKGRKVFWRTLATDNVSETIVQHKIETKEVTKSEVITQTENYYFTRKLQNSHSFSMPVVKSDVEIHVDFPYEIGWLHYDDYTDYEGRALGLGYSLGYNAPGIKATVYVYKENGNNAAKELSKARSDVIEAHGKKAISHEWEPQHRHNHSYYYYIPGDEPDHVSAIHIINANGMFVKARITFFDEPLLRDMTSNFVSSLLDVIGRDRFDLPH